MKFNNIFDQEKWRWDRFFNRECEEVILENKVMLQNLFDAFSGKKAKPGEKKYMRLEDFINLCQLHGLLNENFNLRQATLCFHMSLITHVDEINTSHHMEASKHEFIEALARVAEFNDSIDPEKDMLGYVYSNTSLDIKLSNSIIKLL